MSDPRAEFVEAMRDILQSAGETEIIARIHGWRYSGSPNPARRACTAFADADCAKRIYLEERYEFEGAKKHDHAECRAALLRKIGLEERDGESD